MEEKKKKKKKEGKKGTKSVFQKGGIVQENSVIV